MQSFYKILKEMEIKLHSLLAEVQELKNRARHLEEENDRLRQEVAVAYGSINAEQDEIYFREGPGKGFLNLMGLYDQGFHVCNLHFGRFRDKECLFCMAFLCREQKNAVTQDLQD